MPTECSPQIPSLETLREVASAHGVDPTDADLEAVRGFLAAILPALRELEAAIPAGTVPGGLPEERPA
ncbi:MAG TPA: hypothetical protein VJ689_05980 [Gaiellaceae bacterium]|jgi:hypothetical protein|nr:hypothetical protein [Gaiellaceae bacterium]